MTRVWHKPRFHTSHYLADIPHGLDASEIEISPNFDEVSPGNLHMGSGGKDRHGG
jgi:hypothetical protein